MIPSDPRLQAAVQSAIGTVKKTVAEAAERVVESLGLSSLTSASNKQKQAFNDAQYELRRKLSTLQSVFDESLRESVANELAGRDASGPRNAATDWQSLSLVDDREVEEQVAGDRIAQAIGHECEWELRELAGYMGSLLQRNQAEPRRNPVRPEVLGRALYRGIEAVSDKEEIRSLIAKELGQTVARAMRACYTHMVADLQNRGVQPAGLTVKQTAVSGMGELSAEPETTAPTPVPVPLTPRIDPQRQASR
ncbi:MAG: thymidine phosphorylase, partial [Rhizobacter sp.]|nr:thymidine phosphorylase [Rhizobacter sp.]